MTHIALRTIGTDGVTVTDRPTSERIIATSDDYLTVLAACRAHRVNTYRHRVSHEVRILSETDRAGCARTNPELFAWVLGADVIKHGEYAIPVTSEVLHTYEPEHEPAHVNVVNRGSW